MRGFRRSMLPVAALSAWPAPLLAEAARDRATRSISESLSKGSTLGATILMIVFFLLLVGIIVWQVRKGHRETVEDEQITGQYQGDDADDPEG